MMTKSLLGVAWTNQIIRDYQVRRNLNKFKSEQILGKKGNPRGWKSTLYWTIYLQNCIAYFWTLFFMDL